MDPKIVYGGDFERIVEGNLGELMFMILQSYGDNVLQIDVSTGEKLEANVLLSRAIELAKWYRKNNIGVGDSISIMCGNRLEVAVIATAAFLVGATFAPLNPDYTEGELTHVLSLSKPKAIFVIASNVPKLEKLVIKYPFIKYLFLLGEDDNKTKHLVKYNSLIAKADGNNIDESFVVESYDAQTVATILCSSGTTGMPKGVMCTHDNMTAYVDIARTVFSQMLLTDNPDDAMMGLVPFFHSFGFMTMYLNLLRGKPMIVLSKFNPKLFLDAIVKYKISRMMVPPPVLLFLTKHPLAKQYDLSCLQEVRSGAAPMGRETETKLRSMLNIKHVSQGYGMTETTLGVLLNPLLKPKTGSVGTLVPGMLAKIIDENGKILGENQEGELCLKGPLIMKGYVGDVSATNNCIDEEQWLHTGDVAYYDNEKYFYIVDRLKELIKYKAFQVAPAELEALLVSHPGVQDAAVIGFPDEDAGELPLAYVVRKPGKEISADDLKKFVGDQVSSAKQLRGGVIFISEIPRNPTGKILRRILREQAKNIRSKL